MDSLNKNITEMIQQSALSIAKQTKKQKNPKISSPTRALMKKRREMIENKTPRDHIEYVEICKTIKKKVKEDTRKHNLDEIRETIEASKSLKKVRRTHNWENKGVKIDGEFLSNLRFADDIFLCTETPQELQQMLQELSDESRQMGLKMNITKTKVMVVDNTPINVNNVLIENVPGYVYLGQHYSLKEKNQDKEIQRRIMAGWAAYAKHRDIFKSNIAICLKRQVYNSCVLAAMTYGAETWTLTKQAQNKLAAALTKMERSMLNITYKDRRTNI